MKAFGLGAVFCLMILALLFVVKKEYAMDSPRVPDADDERSFIELCQELREIEETSEESRLDRMITKFATWYHRLRAKVLIHSREAEREALLEETRKAVRKRSGTL